MHNVSFLETPFSRSSKNVICGLIAKGKAKTDFSGFVLDNNESEVNYV